LAPIKVALAIAGAAAAAQGCQGGGLVGDSPDAGSGGGALSGRWAMFKWEDPVAVEIDEAGGVIKGRGCCGGLGDLSAQIDCCGLLTGQVADRHASFGFSFDSGGHYDYTTDVFVSADGTRMAGTFESDYPVAWVRIGATDADLPDADAVIRDLTDARSGDYVLTLADAVPPGNDFTAQQMHWLSLGAGFVWSTLGAFWSAEISWRDADQTMLAGPVPETAPGIPVALALHFEGRALTCVEASMASGLVYHFQAAPRL
jgi:hypothetical protein